MRLRRIELKHPLILAPLAGFTDLAFRRICRDFGIELTYTEMISAKGLLYGSDKSLDLLINHEEEYPLGVQLFGSELEDFKRALEILRKEKRFEALDINMGCPVKKVIRNGDGSYLMKDPEKVYHILKGLREEMDETLSAKMRLGLSKASINVLEVSQAAEEAGVDFLTVHGRTTDQLYSGTADWEKILEVKSQRKIPVFGSGDLFSYDDCKKRLDEGIDGLMLARGVLGNPFLIRELITGEKKPVTIKEKVETMLKHLDYYLEDKTKNGLVEFRAHLMHYLKGVRGGAAIRGRLASLNTKEELEGKLEELVALDTSY